MPRPSDTDSPSYDEHPQHECGVFAIYGNNDNAAQLSFFALYALQHRGQESAGIATAEAGANSKSYNWSSRGSGSVSGGGFSTKTVSHSAGPLHLFKGMGLVSNVFNEDAMRELPGKLAIGHTRYSTAGVSTANNAQPFLLETDLGPMAMAHNGQLTRHKLLKQLVLKRGTGLFTNSDSEIITQMLATNTDRAISPSALNDKFDLNEHKSPTDQMHNESCPVHIDDAHVRQTEQKQPYAQSAHEGGCRCADLSPQVKPAPSKKQKLHSRSTTPQALRMKAQAINGPQQAGSNVSTPQFQPTHPESQNVSSRKINVEAEVDGEVAIHNEVKEDSANNALTLWEHRLVQFMREAEGAYALTLMTADCIYGCRDRFGLRPLCIGYVKHADGTYTYALSSESCAFGPIGLTYLREVKPGEIIRMDDTGLHSTIALPDIQPSIKPALCIFEYVYFARPDSILEDQLVHSVRQRLGAQLARESPCPDADLVSGVPDSSIAAAVGYSAVSGLPFQEVMCKNRYIGRTFIQPDQSMRDNSIRLKFNPLGANLRNKSIVLIDDSIVRGSTMRQLIKLLKSAGCKAVHVRISSPILRFPCYMGVDIGTYDEILATHVTTVEDMRAYLGADSLAFLSIEGLNSSVLKGIDQDTRAKQGHKVGHCNACFTGVYPLQHDQNSEENIGLW